MKTLFLLIGGEIMKPSIQHEEYFTDYKHIIYECTLYYIKSKEDFKVTSREILQCNELEAVTQNLFKKYRDVVDNLPSGTHMCPNCSWQCACSSQPCSCCL